MSLPYFAAGLPACVAPILDVVPLRLLSDTALLRMLDDLRSVVDDADTPDADAGAALHGSSAVRIELERRRVTVPPWNPLGEPASFVVSDNAIAFPPLTGPLILLAAEPSDAEVQEQAERRFAGGA